MKEEGNKKWPITAATTVNFTGHFFFITAQHETQICQMLDVQQKILGYVEMTHTDAAPISYT